MAERLNLTTGGPTEEFEVEARSRGYRFIAGLDEAGRGPLAGPVIAAAVLLPRRCRLPGLNDSKQIAESERNRLFAEIVHRATGVGIGAATEAEIDRLNILQASRLCDASGAGCTSGQTGFSVARRRGSPGLSIPQRAIIKGDGLSCSIAAASIVAKVTRDRLMVEYHRWYPHYNFAEHKRVQDAGTSPPASNAWSLCDSPPQLLSGAAGACQDRRQDAPPVTPV